MSLCHTKQFTNYFEKDCFNYRADGEGDKCKGFVRGLFYNDVIRHKRISVTILFMPGRGKKQSSGPNVSRIFQSCFLYFFLTPLLGDWKENKWSWWYGDSRSAYKSVLPVWICYLPIKFHETPLLTNWMVWDKMAWIFTILCFKIVQMWN